MTFGEYKANGGCWDYKVYANDAGSFGHEGSTIYGYTPSMEDWEIEAITRSNTGAVVLHLICPN